MFLKITFWSKLKINIKYRKKWKIRMNVWIAITIFLNKNVNKLKHSNKKCIHFEIC